MKPMTQKRTKHHIQKRILALVLVVAIALQSLSGTHRARTHEGEKETKDENNNETNN